MRRYYQRLNGKYLSTKIFNLSSGKIGNQVSPMQHKWEATFDNFNFSEVVSYSLRSLLICELVHDEAKRLLIYFRSLHVPRTPNQSVFNIYRTKTRCFFFFFHFFHIVNGFDARFRPSERGKTFFDRPKCDAITIVPLLRSRRI